MGDRKSLPARDVAPRSCGSCKHEMSGLPLNQPCPACGWRPDIRCIACGYDLAGLDEGGPCPECATPIADSLRGDGLAFADQTYLGTLDRGVRLTRWGVLAVVVSWVGVLVVLVTISAAGLSLPSWVEDAFAGGALMAAMALYTVGWWAITSPDPRRGEEPSPTSAAVARYGAIVLAGSLGLLLVVGGLVTVPRGLVTAALLLVTAAHHGAGSLYARRLAVQAGNRRAARTSMQALVAIVTMACAWGVDTALGAFGVVRPPPTSTLASLAQLAMSLLGFTVLIAGLIAIARQYSALGLLREDLGRFIQEDERSRSTGSQ